MACYVLTEVFILRNLECWNRTLLKDTIYWFVLPAFVSFMDITTDKDPITFFKKTIIQLFGIMVLIQYLLNLYTFSLLGELILTPVLVFIGCGAVIAAKDERLVPAKKFFDVIQTVIMVIVVYYAIRQVWYHRTELLENQKIVSFSLPIFLTLMYFPFLYIAKLITSYESLFVRLEFLLPKEKKLQTFARRRILLLCNLNLFKLHSLCKRNTPRDFVSK